MVSMQLQRVLRFFCSLLLVISSISIFCVAVDTIYQNQQVRDGETIVSAANIFELGFFSPNGSNARYVGIWYKEFDKQLVWVANRENPLKDSSGVLMIGNDGNLVIFDGDDFIWSSVANVTSNNTSATLTDTGNLVLREDNSGGFQFWQSFDFPSNVWIPKMKIGMDTRTGRQISLSSWKSESNPSKGNFIVGIDPTQPPQFFTWNGSDKYFRSAQWNGLGFIGLRYLNKDYTNGFDMDVQDGNVFFTFASNENALPRLISLNSSGGLAPYDWDSENKRWNLFRAVPNSPCDYYNPCGPFGRCNDDNNSWSRPCECFPGYEPTNVEEWNQGNWKGGCVRKEPFQCERNDSVNIADDGFFEFPSTKLPDLANYLRTSDSVSCKAACLRNCSCTAFSYVDSISCLLWMNALIDIQSYGTAGGETLYLRLSHLEFGKEPVLVELIAELVPCNFGGKKQPKGYVIVVIVASAVLGTTLLAYIIYRWKTKGRTSWSRYKSIFKNIFTSSSPTGDSLTRNFNYRDHSEVRNFSWKDIQDATENFGIANKLGEGGFGPVYKGNLFNGQEVAVKRLSRSSGQGIDEFKNEVVLISKLQHRNLVNLVGLCIHEEEKLLVYEYMPNKSLDKLIFGAQLNDERLLDWEMRYDIIEGIARGVLYLHRDSRLKIIHRDLKTSNILLDEGMNPKISDFGMARIFVANQSAVNTNRVVGTYGYMSPEYAMHGSFSEKSDVFSFGMVLLEIVTGQRNNGYHFHENATNLPGHAWQLWTQGKALELLDPRLIETNVNSSEVIRCIHVGLLCVQDNENDRPSMATILSMLTSTDMILPVPEKPVFSISKQRQINNLSSTSSSTQSRNTVSISIIQGR